MRKINYIVVHCIATREGFTLTSEVLEAEHRRRGFRTTGYHYYICLLYTSTWEKLDYVDKVKAAFGL